MYVLLRLLLLSLLVVSFTQTPMEAFAETTWQRNVRTWKERRAKRRKGVRKPQRRKKRRTNRFSQDRDRGQGGFGITHNRKTTRQRRKRKKTSYQRRMSTSAAKRKILQLVNAERRRLGRRPLKKHGSCGRMAQNHANWLAKSRANRRRAHHNSGARARSVSRSRAVSENVVYTGAAHGVNPERAMRIWMNSGSHKANIRSRRWKGIGIGVAKNHRTGEVSYTQCFIE